MADGREDPQDRPVPFVIREKDLEMDRVDMTYPKPEDINYAFYPHKREIKYVY